MQAHWLRITFGLDTSLCYMMRFILTTSSLASVMNELHHCNIFYLTNKIQVMDSDLMLWHDLMMKKTMHLFKNHRYPLKSFNMRFGCTLRFR